MPPYCLIVKEYLSFVSSIGKDFLFVSLKYLFDSFFTEKGSLFLPKGKKILSLRKKEWTLIPNKRK